MNKILVTGSTGFIGKSLVNNLLKDKIKVFAIIRKSDKNVKSASKIKKKHKNFFPVFFNKNQELSKKISNLKPQVVVNLAVYYMNRDPDHSDIPLVINSNVLFPTMILDLCCKSKASKIINLCSVMQCDKNEIDNPLNFYGLTKILFRKTMMYYQKVYPEKKFLNLYIGNTYGPNDPRAKILPIIINNYKRNKKTTILTKNLNINILHVEDVVNGIKMLIDNEKKSNSYFINSNTNFNLYRVIKKFNLKAKRKVKMTWLNKKINSREPNKFGLKKIPKWKQKFNVINHFYRHLNENC